MEPSNEDAPPPCGQAPAPPAAQVAESTTSDLETGKAIQVIAETAPAIVVEGEKKAFVPSADGHMLTAEEWEDTWQELNLSLSTQYRARHAIPAFEAGKTLKGFESVPMGKSFIALWYDNGNPIFGAM